MSILIGFVVDDDDDDVDDDDVDDNVYIDDYHLLYHEYTITSAFSSRIKICYCFCLFHLLSLSVIY